MMLGSGLLGTLIAVSLSLAGASTWIIGLVMASYFSGFATGAFSGHIIIARVGHIRAFTVFATLFSAAAFSHVFSSNEFFWSFLRIIQGYTVAGLFMCCESWLSEKSDNSTRGTVLSVYMVVIYLAQALGQLILLSNSTLSYIFFGVITVLASLGVIPVALTRIPQPTPPNSERLSLRAIWSISPLGLVASFTTGTIIGAIFALGPVFATKSGFSIGSTGLFMSSFLFGGLILQYPIGTYSDKFDRRKLITCMLVGVFLASALITLTKDQNLVYLLIFAILFGAFSFIIYPLALSHANDFADATQFVGVTAGLLLSYSLGAIAGPALAALAMQLLSPLALFYFTGTTALLGAIFAMWRMRYGPSRDQSSIGLYSPIPVTTPIALELDPRAPDLAEPQEISKRN
jgi:MFS family permease